MICGVIKRRASERGAHFLPSVGALFIACTVTACHSPAPRSTPSIALAPSPAPAETLPPTTDAQDLPPPVTAVSKPGPAELASCSCPDNTPKPAFKRKPKPVLREMPPTPIPAAPMQPVPGEASVKLVEGPSASILGKKVRGQEDEDLGRVVDILADSQGRVRVAIIEFGGFLGVGDRRIAVDWQLLKFQRGEGDAPLLLNANRRELQETPEYKGTDRPLALMAPAAAAAPPPATPPATPK